MSKNSYFETKKALEKMRVKRAEFIASQIAKIDKNDILFDMSDKEIITVLKSFISSLSDNKKTDEIESEKQIENNEKNNVILNENNIVKNSYTTYDYLPEDDVDDSTANS